MRKKFLFIFLIFLVNSIFSYSSKKTSTDEELQRVFDKNEEIIVVYRASIKDNIPKKYTENIIFINSNRFQFPTWIKSSYFLSIFNLFYFHFYKSFG